MVKEIEFYDMIADSLAASEEEIRKAYYLKARQVHADKNPNDPLAAENFQVLGEAYLVLSDPAQKDTYDRNGMNCMSKEMMLDPIAFLFRSELFEDYIGHAAVASMASTELAGENDSPDKVHHSLKVLRETNVKREELKMLAMALRILGKNFQAVLVPAWIIMSFPRLRKLCVQEDRSKFNQFDGLEFIRKDNIYQ